MSRPNKLDILSPEQKEDINKYFQNHSSRETEAYIKEKYNVDVSYVTIIKYIETAYKKSSEESKTLRYQSILAAQDILRKYFNLYNETKNIHTKFTILVKEGEFINSLLKTLPSEVGGGKLTREDKMILDWQKKQDE